MLTPLSIWDEEYQMPTDPHLESDSFMAADTDDTGNQTHQIDVPPQPPQQVEEKPQVSDPTAGGEGVAADGKPQNPVVASDTVSDRKLDSDAYIAGGANGIKTEQINEPVLYSIPPSSPTRPDPIIGLFSGGDGAFAADVQSPDPLLGFDAFIAADNEENTSHPPNSETKAARRSRKAPEDLEKRPSWLPENWEMICKTRTSGATAGLIDRYYVEPVSQQRFRSRNEVLRYLETGSKLKKKPDSDANTMPSDTPKKDTPKKDKEKSSTKSKKTGTKKRKRETPWTFDFQNPPGEVSWALIDGTQGVWKPFIANEAVPDTSTVEWSFAFERVCEMKN